MYVNNNSSIQSNSRSFGQLKFYVGQKNFLRKFVSTEEKFFVENLIKEQEHNPVDIIVFSKLDSYKLESVITPKNMNYRIVKYSQYFWQSTLKFLNKCCHKADSINYKMNKDKI